MKTITKAALRLTGKKTANLTSIIESGEEVSILFEPRTPDGYFAVRIGDKLGWMIDTAFDSPAIGSEPMNKKSTIPEVSQDEDWFLKIVGGTLDFEGGFVDDPNDAGGKTNRGVTEHTIRRFLGLSEDYSITTKQMLMITEELAKTIYRVLYWNVIRGDELVVKYGLPYAFKVFDFAVHSGTTVAWKAHEQAVGDESEITKLRLERMRSRPTWSYYEKGWMNRLKKVDKFARNLV